MGGSSPNHDGRDNLLCGSFSAEILVTDKILTVLKNARAQIKCLGSETDDVNNAHITEIDEVITSLEKPNPDKNGFYYWVVRLGVHSSLVQDGADFTDKRVHDMLTHHFCFAYGDELSGKVIIRPPDKSVAKEMGYDTINSYLQQRK